MSFGEGSPPEALREHPGFLLNWVAARSRNELAARLAELDLLVSHFGLLSLIAHEPGLTQQELVQRSGQDPSTMVVTLDALEAKGRAERRPHPTDRRKRAVYLTAAGRALVPRARRAAEQSGAEVFGSLSAAERDTLLALLGKVAEQG